jgi:hypothetical protein
MIFKNAVLQARTQGTRIIMRDANAAMFDVVKYNPEHLEQEDLWAEDWEPASPQEVKEELHGRR